MHRDIISLFTFHFTLLKQNLHTHAHKCNGKYLCTNSHLNKQRCQLKSIFGTLIEFYAKKHDEIVFISTFRSRKCLQNN